MNVLLYVATSNFSYITQLISHCVKEACNVVNHMAVVCYEASW